MLKNIDTGEIAARPREAGDKTKPRPGRHRRMKTIGIVVVAALAANASRIAGRERAPPPAGGPVRPPAPAADRYRPSAQRYSIVTFSPSIIAGFFQALRESARRRPSVRVRRCRVRGTRSPAFARLLRARHQRPRRRAAEQRDELAPPHVLPSSRGSHPTTRCRKYRAVHHSKFSGQCLSWVKLGPVSDRDVDMSALPPTPDIRMHRQNRHAKCQERTHALQQNASPSITSSVNSQNLIERLPRKAISSVPKYANRTPFAFVVNSCLVWTADYAVGHRDR